LDDYRRALPEARDPEVFLLLTQIVSTCKVRHNKFFCKHFFCSMMSRRKSLNIWTPFLNVQFLQFPKIKRIFRKSDRDFIDLLEPSPTVVIMVC
jgi:hypothetical protein